MIVFGDGATMHIIVILALGIVAWAALELNIEGPAPIGDFADS